MSFRYSDKISRGRSQMFDCDYTAKLQLGLSLATKLYIFNLSKLKYCAKIVQIIDKYFANIGQILCKFIANIYK